MSHQRTAQERLECEARHWLRVTEGKPEAVEERLASIAEKRGKAAAEKLRVAMRRQYRNVIGGRAGQ